MHIPDGYLGPQTCGAMYAIMGPLWYVAARKVRSILPKKHLALPAIGGAFTFAVMMFNIPMPGGAAGHAVGGAVVAVLLGPWTAMVSISLALTIQAFLLGDGGITSLAANALALAFVMPFSAYYLFLLLSRIGLSERISAFAAGYAGLNCGAFLQAVLLGIQPLLESSGGRPLYSPYPLAVTIPAISGPNLIFFGLVEGLLTMLVLTLLQKTELAGRLAPQKAAVLNEQGAET